MLKANPNIKDKNKIQTGQAINLPGSADSNQQVNQQQARQGGPGDPPGSGEFEFNLTFSFGPQVGFDFGSGLAANIKVWTFGEISTMVQAVKNFMIIRLHQSIRLISVCGTLDMARELNIN